MFRIVTLGDGGENDIAGRAIVVHAGEDDLGKGGDAESKKTGNAGARKNIYLTILIPLSKMSIMHDVDMQFSRSISTICLSVSNKWV